MGDTPTFVDESNDANQSRIVVFDTAETAPGLIDATSPIEIKLNFINHSNDVNNSEIVIFAKNERVDLDELAIAWTVIRYCGQGCNHPFVYPLQSAVSCVDSWGNHTPLLPADPGQQFAMTLTPSGNMLEAHGPASVPTEIEVLNALPTGAITAGVYKDGRLLAQKTGLAPMQKAAFEFRPVIWIGVVSQVTEGEVMNSAILSSINTEISLMGISSADIVMTGGGAGAQSKPFEFTLENVTYA